MPNQSPALDAVRDIETHLSDLYTLAQAFEGLHDMLAGDGSLADEAKQFELLRSGDLAALFAVFSMHTEHLYDLIHAHLSTALEAVRGESHAN
ncbi:MAG: hypothetical protein HYX63_13505 [Gammaproteobacteria bacterium]|nr:hypothetical protein [Gammaproteobacteria bacterium]